MKQARRLRLPGFRLKARLTTKTGARGGRRTRSLHLGATSFLACSGFNFDAEPNETVHMLVARPHPKQVLLFVCELRESSQVEPGGAPDSWIRGGSRTARAAEAFPMEPSPHRRHPPSALPRAARVPGRPRSIARPPPTCRTRPAASVPARRRDTRRRASASKGPTPTYPAAAFSISSSSAKSFSVTPPASCVTSVKVIRR